MRAIRVLPVCFLLGLYVLWVGLPRAAHAQSPVSFEEYRNRVAQTLALAQQANTLAASERAVVLNNAANTLDAIRSVQTPSGAVVAVDNSELVALLRDPTRTENAIARLTALRDALAQPLARVSANDVALLNDILSRPPFVPAENWYDAILAAIAEFFERLASNTARGVLEARDLVILVAVLVVAAVLAWFVRTLRRNLVPEQELPPELMGKEARTPAEAFDNAQRYINAGDYRSAVRQLYLATLLMLDRRGRIKYDPTLTNREYLRQVSKDTRAATALQPIVETFDRTWYGFEPISSDEFETYRRRVEQVREL